MRPVVRRTQVATRLSEVKMLAGGEFKLVVANLAFGFLAVALLHVWQYVMVVAMLHGVLILAAKSDLQAREIYLEYTRQSDRYIPWPMPRRDRFNRRPVGFGRDQLL
jgi:type IV secretory pathway TrbD component